MDRELGNGGTSHLQSSANDYFDVVVSLKDGQPPVQDARLIDSGVGSAGTSDGDEDSLEPVCDVRNAPCEKRMPPVRTGRENAVYPEGVLMKGILKSINADKGYGFIACDEIRKNFGKDVFAHIKHIHTFQRGDRLKFYVDMNNQKPQAVDVEFDDAPDDRGFLTGEEDSRESRRDTRSKSPRRRDTRSKSPRSGPQKTVVYPEGVLMIGVLKSINADNGYGFIACDEIQKSFGKDVFAHIKHIQNFRRGDRLKFYLEMNKQKPQAVHVELDNDAEDERGPLAGQEGSQEESLQKSRRKSARSGRRKAPGVLMTGILKSINADNGYGFIACDEIQKTLGKDVFAHIKHIQHFRRGDRLKFYVEMNKDNPQAVDVELDDAPDERRRFSGVIKSYTSVYGYGFIDCAATKELYSRDVFVHKDQIQMFRQGDWITFVVEVRNGQPQAEALELTSAPEIVPPPVRHIGKRLARICSSHRDTSTEIENLLLAQADPNYIDTTGSTPLMICALHLSPLACWPKIRILLRYGASVDVDIDGRPLLEWVRTRVGRSFADALIKLDHRIKTGEDGRDALDDIQFCVEPPNDLD